jgi:hypothetical protein
MRKTITGLYCVIGLYGQTCTILAPTNCGAAGVYAGPPTLQSFVTGLSTALPTALHNVAGSPQPRVLYSGQIVPAGASFMISDPYSCPVSGTCQFNNPTVIDNFIDSLLTAPPNGVGLKSIDINLWVSPLFQSSQYAAGCATYGVCYTAPSYYHDWFSHGLSTYDTVFAHIASSWPGVKVRLAPMFSGDATITCGIAQGAGNFTELQLEQCAAPLWAAMVARWHVDDMTVSHEPCGVFALVLGTSPSCVTSFADMDTFVRHTAAAVRATSQNSSIRIGAGALIGDAGGACPSGQNFWCDWYTNLMPANVLDFGGIDMYPGVSAPSADYNNTLAIYAAMAQHVTSAGKVVVANESSSLRWSNAAGPGGEDNTYWGCAASEWMTDGTFLAWANAVPGAWAPANGVQIYSIFPIEELLMVSTDTNNNHCWPSDGFETLLSAVLAKGTSLSPEGALYGAMAAGWNTSLQGNAHLTGRAHLGH